MIASLLWLIYYPDILLLSPFSLLNYHWDDTIISIIILSTITGLLASLPVILLHLYLFLKPALFPHELRLIRALIQWTTLTFIACLCLSPLLIFNLPYFIMDLLSSTLVFIPTLHSLAKFALQLVLAFTAIWAIPALVWAGAKRLVLYFFIAIFSALFSDLVSFLLAIIPLALVIEASVAATIYLKLSLGHYCSRS